MQQEECADENRGHDEQQEKSELEARHWGDEWNEQSGPKKEPEYDAGRYTRLAKLRLEECHVLPTFRSRLSSRERGSRTSASPGRALIASQSKGQDRIIRKGRARLRCTQSDVTVNLIPSFLCRKAHRSVLSVLSLGHRVLDSEHIVNSPGI